MYTSYPVARLSIHIGIVETDGRVGGVYDAERDMIRISLVVVIVSLLLSLGTARSRLFRLNEITSCPKITVIGTIVVW